MGGLAGEGGFAREGAQWGEGLDWSNRSVGPQVNQTPSGFGLVWFGLASTRPVVSGASLAVHTRPKAWECGFVTPLLSRIFSHLVSLTACAVRRFLVRCSTFDALHRPSTRSRIGGEELNYGGPLAEFHCLHCCRHVHMVRWNCRPVVRALSFRGYACV